MTAIALRHGAAKLVAPTDSGGAPPVQSGPSTKRASTASSTTSTAFGRTRSRSSDRALPCSSAEKETTWLIVCSATGTAGCRLRVQRERQALRRRDAPDRIRAQAGLRRRVPPTLVSVSNGHATVLWQAHTGPQRGAASIRHAREQTEGHTAAATPVRNRTQV